MNINDIFAIEQYDEAYDFVQSHEYTTIEDLGNGQYKLIQLHIPTEEEKAKAEAERIAHLSLTRGDVFRALYQARQISRADLREMIINNETVSIFQKELALIDFDEALNFFRGNPLIDIMGNALGINKEKLDKFFETNNYEELL